MDLAKFDALDNLFDELVPMCGKAENLAGEIVRAASRIGSAGKRPTITS